MAAEERESIHLVYAYPVAIVGGREGGVWYEVTPGTPDILGERRVYGHKLSRGRTIGAIYHFDKAKNDGQIYGGSRRYVRMITDNAQRLLWEGQAAEHNAEMEAARQEKANKTTATQEILAPLRAEYKKRIGYTARAAYLAHIITLITS